MKKLSIILAAAMLILLAGCKEMPEEFAAMPDTLSDDELELFDAPPAYKCIETHYDNGGLKEKYERICDRFGGTIEQYDIDTETGKRISGSVQKYGTEYDEDGNVLKSLCYGSDKETVLRVYKNTFDGSGNMVSTAVYYRHGDKLKKTSYFEMEYDEHGSETEIISADADDGVYAVDKYAYEYDENGNISKKTVDKSIYQDETAEYTYTYDDDGKMLTEFKKTIKKNGKKKKTVKDFITKYEYDDRGNLIKKTSDVYKFEQHNVETYEYDDKNRKTRETIGTGEIIYEYEDYQS